MDYNKFQKFIDWFNSRKGNIQFYVRIILISFLPVFTYMGLTEQEITTWASLFQIIFEIIKNPYLFFLWGSTLIQSFTKTYDE